MFECLLSIPMSLLIVGNKLEELSDLARQLSSEGQRLCPEVWERQNGHGVCEYVVRELLWLQNGAFAATGLWERQLQAAGKKLGGTKVTDKPSFAMKLWNAIFTMRFLWHGGKYGPNMDLGLHPETLKAMQSSGLVRQLSPMLNYRQCDMADPADGYIGAGCWRPVGYDTTAEAKPPAPALLKAIVGYLAVDFLGRGADDLLPNLGASLSLRYPKLVELRDPDRPTREVQLRPGDDYLVMVSFLFIN
jgi:hypothetical protein